MLQELEAVLPSVEDPIDGLREAARQADFQRTWMTDLPARLGAVATDACVLLALDALFVQLVAIICGVTAGELLGQAAPAVAVFCLVPSALYFVIFGGIGGLTPGAWFCGLPAADAPRPLRLRAILLRTVGGNGQDRKAAMNSSPRSSAFLAPTP